MLNADGAKLLATPHPPPPLALSDKHESRTQKIEPDRHIKDQLKQEKEPDAHKYTRKHWPECMARHGFTLQE